jgi:hypothetical protein
VAKMTIILTKAAYERFAKMSRIDGMDAAKLTALLQEACDRGEGGMLQWMGKPAFYLHNAYWVFELSGPTRELTLLDCFGMLQAIAV